MTQSEAGADRGGIQVIKRAARILGALKYHQGGLSLGQIAEEVELPRSTVQRIVAALQDEMLVMTGPRGRRFRLGPEINALADSTRSDIVESYRYLLADISMITGETADLSLMRGDVMVFLDQVPGVHRLRTVSFVGEVFPLTTTANGRACLAQLDPAHAEQLSAAEWQRLGNRGNMDAFLSILNEVRQTGIALDDEQHTPGVSAMGIAFRSQVGDLLSISVPVPSSRFAEVRHAVAAALQRTLAEIATPVRGRLSHSLSTGPRPTKMRTTSTP